MKRQVRLYGVSGIVLCFLVLDVAPPPPAKKGCSCGKDTPSVTAPADESASAAPGSFAFRPLAPASPLRDTRDEAMEVGADAYSFHLAAPERELPNLHGKDDVIVTADLVRVVVEYPIAKPIEVDVKAPSAGRFTRGDLASAVSGVYAFVYAEEERTTKVPVGKAGSTENRNKTTGTFGIWGHDLADLDLVRVHLRVDAAGVTYVFLDVDS